MKKYSATINISAIIIAAGIIVIVGWFINSTLLKSIRPDWVTMKTTTAMCFILSGILLYILAEYRMGHKYIDKSIAYVLAGIIIYTMGLFLIAAIFGLQIGQEEFLITESSGAIETVIPGRPSISTMLAFLIFAVSAVNTIRKPQPNAIKTAGWIIAALGGLAIVGYAFNIPILHYYISGVNTSMAFNTAVLFVLLGTGLIKLAK